MEIRKTRPIEVVVDIQCDRCGRGCLVKVAPAWQGLEYATLTAHWGYGSKDHDGERYELHLCEGCFFHLVGEIEHERFVSTMFDKESYPRGSIERQARLSAGNNPQPSAGAIPAPGIDTTPDSSEMAPPLPPSAPDPRMKSAEAERYARVALLAGVTFGDSTKARRWLMRPLRRFDERSPLSIAGTEDGAKAVEELLQHIAHGTPD